MPKNIDGVSFPERRKSIRNIPIPESRRSKVQLDGISKRSSAKVPLNSVSEEELSRTAGPTGALSSTGGKKRGKRWLYLIIGAIIIIFGFLSFFSGATITYTPRSQALTWSGESYSAYKNAGSGLLFSVVKLSGDKSTTLSATGEAPVSRKASGTIVIYNNGTGAQPLVDTTRFQSNEGKIYRIAKTVSVPGKTSAGPGSVEATVYADEAGESYNIGLTDFTVPGLKGTPRYDTVYARSKTPMTGGFVGNEKVVNPDDLATAKADLRNQLTQELIQKAQGEAPADFILYPSLTSVTFEDLPQTAGTGDSATIGVRGDLVGLMFKRSDLAATIASGKATTSPNDSLNINSLEDLSVSFAGGVPSDLLNLAKVDFTVIGSATLVWQTDEISLKSAVAGHAKSELPQIIANYPAIAGATVTVSPFWKSSFPSDSSQITVKQLAP